MLRTLPGMHLARTCLACVLLLSIFSMFKLPTGNIEAQGEALPNCMATRTFRDAMIVRKTTHAQDLRNLIISIWNGTLLYDQLQYETRVNLTATLHAWEKYLPIIGSNGLFEAIAGASVGRQTTNNLFVAVQIDFWLVHWLGAWLADLSLKYPPHINCLNQAFVTSNVIYKGMYQSENSFAREDDFRWLAFEHGSTWMTLSKYFFREGVLHAMVDDYFDCSTYCNPHSFGHGLYYSALGTAGTRLSTSFPFRPSSIRIPNSMVQKAVYECKSFASWSARQRCDCATGVYHSYFQMMSVQQFVEMPWYDHCKGALFPTICFSFMMFYVPLQLLTTAPLQNLISEPGLNLRFILLRSFGIKWASSDWITIPYEVVRQWTDVCLAKNDFACMIGISNAVPMMYPETGLPFSLEHFRWCAQLDERAHEKGIATACLLGLIMGTVGALGEAEPMFNPDIHVNYHMCDHILHLTNNINETYPVYRMCTRVLEDDGSVLYSIVLDGHEHMLKS